VPGWLVEDREAWALVPLLHFERLVGMVVLGRPPVTRQLDWEDFDLLRVVGQQLASYLAENNGQVALLEANRFDEFNRRIAFVMHDIKNLASQLSLLSRNAERHAENPAFRADMLVTLRNSGQAQRPAGAPFALWQGRAGKLAGTDVADVCKGVVTRYAGAPAAGARCWETSFGVLAHRETLEQVLLHLVQNAIDASPQGCRCCCAGASRARRGASTWSIPVPA
jgi:signal transduction histidine kinase